MSKITKFTTENTLVDYPRLEKILECLEQTKNIPGYVAEVGVYKGGTAYLIGDNTNKTVYLFDTFKGMPAVNKEKDLHEEGDFSDTSLSKVYKLLIDFYPRIVIYKGLFPKSFINSYSGQVFSLVHLDCDIYKSVKESLEFFYPKMSKGGIIIMDDYNEPNCPGAKLAVNEFIADKKENIIETVQSQAIIIKE